MNIKKNCEMFRSPLPRSRRDGRRLRSQASRNLDRRPRTRGEDGMATVLFIALLAIMMVFVMVESSALVRLHREVKLLEQQQVKRITNSSLQTNTVSSVKTP